jgi:hypothetical protein
MSFTCIRSRRSAGGRRSSTRRLIAREDPLDFFRCNASEYKG